MEVIKNKHPKSMERGYDLAGKALTSRSDRPRASYGSLEMSLQHLTGRCTQDRKCVRAESHAGAHWPDSKEQGR